MRRILLLGLLVLLPVACGDDGGEETAADDTSTTAEADETTTTEDLESTGTTASTATEETTTTPAPATQPPATQPPATTPTTAPGPRVTSLTASPADCDGTGQTTLTWTTTGAVSVEVSIDNENGTFQSDLPPNGSGSFPGACFGDSQTYFVKAVAADGTSSTRSVSASS